MNELRLLPRPLHEGAIRTVDDAALFLAGFTCCSAIDLLQSRRRMREAVRRARQFCHPDAGGEHETFLKVQRSGELLRRHHDPDVA